MSKNPDILDIIIYTLFLIGIGVGVFGGYQYINSTQRIADIDGEREEIKELVENLETTSAGVPLATADIKLRTERGEHIDTQRQGRLFAGVGLAVVGVAWMLRDFVTARKKRQEQELREG